MAVSWTSGILINMLSHNAYLASCRIRIRIINHTFGVFAMKNCLAFNNDGVYAGVGLVGRFIVAINRRGCETDSRYVCC